MIVACGQERCLKQTEATEESHFWTRVSQLVRPSVGVCVVGRVSAVRGWCVKPCFAAQIPDDIASTALNQLIRAGLVYTGADCLLETSTVCNTLGPLRNFLSVEVS